MEHISILFCTSPKIGASLIRAATWSSFSHVCIVNGDEVIEAVRPKVRVTTLSDIQNNHDNCIIVNIPVKDKSAAIHFARAQIGKDYDMKGMLGLGINRDWQEDDAWWCSELVAAAIHAGGNILFREGVMHRITPQHLWMLNFDK